MAYRESDLRDFRAYITAGGTLDIDSWLAAGRPTAEGIPPDVTDEDGISDYDAWKAYRSAGGNLDFDAWFASGKPTSGADTDYDEWIEYSRAGGNLDFDAWIAAGKPGATRDEGDVDADVEGEDFAAQLAEAVEAYRTQIREMSERERAEAQRLGARDIGKMGRMTQQALLAQGRTAAEIEQLTAGGMEAGARSLNDLLQALNISERRQLAGAEQFGIGTMISGEQLEQRQREMALAQSQYQQTFGEQRRQFGEQLGLSQQQLAQLSQYQQGQLGLGQQQAQAGIWGPLFGALGTIGGAYLGGPGGAAIGQGIGSTVGSWFG